MEKKGDKTEAAQTRKEALSDDRRKLLSAMMEKEAAEKQAADLQAAGIQAAQDMPGQDSGTASSGDNPFATPGGNPGPGTPPGQGTGQGSDPGPNFGGPGVPPGMENTAQGNPAAGFQNPFGGTGFQPGMMQSMMQGMAAGQPPGMGPGQMPGMMPGMNPGMNPGMMGGMMPGFGQGMFPGMNPMSQMFGQPGQNPFAGFNPMNAAGIGAGGAQGQGGNSQTGKDNARKSGDTKPPSPLVAIKASGTRPPFFCVHAILGSVFPYHNLALHMEKDQPFYGLQSTAVDGKTESSDTIEGMACDYLDAIRDVQPKGPYYLGGYSFGGWIAYEMARQLREAGEKINLLAIFGTLAPPITNPYSQKMKYAMEYMEDFNNFVLHSFMADNVRMNHGMNRSAFMDKMMNNPYMSPALRMYYSHIRSQLQYSAKPMPVEVELFLTQELQEAFSFDLTMGWDILCANVGIHRVSGNHISTFHDPHVRDLATKLTACLKKAQTGQV
ncbi:MAG TPA: hypothetical protein DHV36_14710 [Desulfobacteraceae bacterium]|nr:hypothetical protein [Desulfobacteraceae bacterium]